jgi:hypothetical protein
MNEELEKFMALRDRAIEGLVRCDVLLSEDEILRLGYECVDFGGAVSGSDEHEYTVYSKGDKRMVFVQTYTEREGGLYFQTLYLHREFSEEEEKPLVEASVLNPSVSLIETILHYRGVNIPGTDRQFSDNSIYLGCHHFETIAKDKALAELAVEKFRNLEGAGPSGGIKDDRKEKVLEALSIRIKP